MKMTVEMRIAASVAPAQRDEVEDRDEEPERDRVLAPDGEEDDRGDRSGHQADEQVARHIAANRPVDVPPDALVTDTRRPPEEAQEAL